jgi:hypothetical protein
MGGSLSAGRRSRSRYFLVSDKRRIIGIHGDGAPPLDGF